jgi:hypothetical protein
MNMSKELKRDWLPKLQERYGHRNRQGKSRMLDELCEDYKYERKYAIKLLSGGLPVGPGRVHPGPERRYELRSPVGSDFCRSCDSGCRITSGGMGS